MSKCMNCGKEVMNEERFCEACKAETYACDFCGKEYSVVEENWFDLVAIDNEDDVKGSVCEHCVETHSTKEIFDKTGSILVDDFDSGEAENIRSGLSA